MVTMILLGTFYVERVDMEGRWISVWSCRKCVEDAVERLMMRVAFAAFVNERAMVTARNYLEDGRRRIELCRAEQLFY